jgi:hypothetical protein
MIIAINKYAIISIESWQGLFPNIIHNYIAGKMPPNYPVPAIRYNLINQRRASMPKFWMVWCEKGSIPTVMHETTSAAHAEALRLATLNVDKHFFVLEAVHYYTGMVHIQQDILR